MALPARAQELAEAPVAEALVAAGLPRWSGIVFAKRKLAALALHHLVLVLPRLTFLRPCAIMGHGGRLAATSLTTKACLPAHLSVHACMHACRQHAI